MSPAGQEGLKSFIVQPIMDQRRNDALLAAIMDVVSGQDLNTTLRRIVESARMLSHAKYGALGILGDNGMIEELVFVGMDEETAASMGGGHPEGKGVLGVLMSHPHSIRMDRLSEHPESVGMPHGHPRMDSFLGVPVRVRGSVFGNLYLTEKVENQSFTEQDEDLVTSLAAVAGLAIENARSYEQRQQLAVYMDRDRIARDLHDLVIQRLFATGMSLNALARSANLNETESTKVQSAIDDLDGTIKQIRQTIFALTSKASTIEHASVRRRVMHEVETYSNLLGSSPALTFDGAVDALVDDKIATHLLAALRELLSNAMKHAQAKRFSVSVQILDDQVVLTVADDGVGIKESERQSGLANLRNRAEQLGGTFECTRRLPSGTRARWSVPVR